MTDNNAAQTTVQSVITPNDQTVRKVFNSSRSYFIDIYQREYKWTEKQVKTLLNDLEVRFGLGKRSKTAPSDIQQEVLGVFDPYFLNTYLTHTSSSATSIVDGQQRLSTLLLVLIKLYQMLKKVEDSPENKGKTFASSTLGKLIFEEDDMGTATRFKIFNPNREATLRALIDGNMATGVDETQKRLIENFKIVSDYFDNYLASTDKKEYDLVKLTYYLYFLLDRVSIVEIRIDRQNDVAMIFEVVNDRGLGLKPYEILKGKFIGNLPAADKEAANKIWVELQNRYFSTELKNTTEVKIDLDDFFRIYFRAKFANGEAEYKSYETDYHYEIYRRPELRKHFGDFTDHQVMYDRIRYDIQYFADLYHEMRTDYSPTRPHLFYNKLQEQNQQYLLIMSAVKRNDTEKEEKIKTISAKFDQLHVILRLLGLYESNKFQLLIYSLNKELREKTNAECRTIFDNLILSTLKEEQLLDKNFTGSVADMFVYERFKGVRNSSVNFSKYVLMRIDRWLAELLDKPSYCTGALIEVEERFNKTNRRRYGMHLEHIYAYNDPNRTLFPDPVTGVFDVAGFEQVRNKLGMVLLLKDLQNISSNNDVYTDKVTDYTMSDIIWNQVLAGHLPGVDFKVLPAPFQNGEVKPDPTTGVFPVNMVEERQKLMFEAIKTIWANV